jgi:hypothetical protein
VTSHDLTNLGHRRSKRPNRGPISAIGGICAVAFIGLLATTDHAMAASGGDDCSNFVSQVCYVNGQKGQTVCEPHTNNPVHCVVSTPPSRPAPPPSPDVLTQHNDNSRTGAQLHETILKPSNVGPNTFGRLYERSVQGQIIAQPLYVSNLSIPNLGVRNVVYVATRENMVYAFDADDINPDPSGLIWSYHVNANPPLTPDDDPVPKMCPETVGPMGIVSTPVIDRETGTMYLVARHQMSDHGQIWLHALDITTGKYKAGTPGRVKISGGYSDTAFESVELSRAGLLLVNGAIIIGFSALNCDGAVTPGWHGWVLAYRASDLQTVGAFATTSKSGWGGGVWASGKGIVADTLGNIYFETANGSVDDRLSGKGSCTGISELSESFVKLKLGPSPSYGLTCASYYTVSNWKALNDGQDADAGQSWHHGDTDLGSSGPVLLPGNRLVGGGKQGKLYVLDPGTMSLTQDQAAGAWVPTVPGGSDGFQAFVNTWHDDDSQPICMTPDSVLGTRCFMPHSRYEEDEGSGPNIHSGVIYWNGRLYGMPEKDYLLAFNYDPSSGSLDTSPSTMSDVRAPDGMPGAAISLSANGSGSGVIWASIPKYNGQYQNVPGALVAFDAVTLKELWRDDDSIGFPKFNPPTIAGGKVFRPTFADKLVVYGLKNGTTPAGCYNVWQVYENFTSEKGLLGDATDIALLAPDNIGMYWNFKNGAIYWTQQTCGHEVHGPIFERWKAIGLSQTFLAQSFLGYPTTDQQVTPDGIGRYNHFQHGSIYWTPTTGAHEVHGPIRGEWSARGWEQSSLGYPVSDETDEVDGSGRVIGQVSLFEHGAIHWKPTTGSISVSPNDPNMQLDPQKRPTGVISVSPNDPNMLLGPQEANTDRPGMDIAGAAFVLPQANPTMCEVSCAGNPACKAWTYLGPNTMTGSQPLCYLKNGIPFRTHSNWCTSGKNWCTSGIKVAVRPANMSPMRGASDQWGGSPLKDFDLPVSDPRLCQGECAENGSCKAWSYGVPGTQNSAGPYCWLKSTQPGPVENKCCSSGAKK